jgi:hypothetical protein
MAPAKIGVKMDTKKKNHGFHPASALLGGFLILLGVIFLVGELLNIRIGSFIWPFFIIGPGLSLFLLALVADDDVGQGLSAVSGLVTMVGLILFFQNVTDHWASWSYAWALIAPTSIGLGMFGYALLKGKPELRRESLQIVKVGLGIFVVAAIFFELIIGVGGLGLGRYGWPLLLIALGIFALARNLTAGWHREVEITPVKAPQEEYHVYDNS